MRAGRPGPQGEIGYGLRIKLFDSVYFRMVCTRIKPMQQTKIPIKR